MKATRKLCGALLTLALLASPAFAQDEMGPLDFAVPDGWMMKYTLLMGGGSLYRLASVEGSFNKRLVILSQLPSDSPPGDLDKIADGLADDFVNAAKTQPEWAAKIDLDAKARASFRNEAFSFRSIVYKNKEGDGRQAAFVFSDGKMLWNGGFTGTTQQWEETLAMLRTLKKTAAPKPPE